MDLVLPLAALILAGFCVLVPILLKHRLYNQQLNLLAKAIEKGIKPGELRESLSEPPRSGDINGNWKAGVILVGLGCILFFIGIVNQLVKGFNSEWLMALVLILLGWLLIHIHKRIVGRIVPISEADDFGRVKQNGPDEPKPSN